jgi:ABC-type polysaccharide/polyol phosphate export permease
VYPISQLPPQFQPIAIYNPLTAPVEMVKYGFLQTAPPKAASVMVCLITLAVLLPVGIWLFGKFERAAVSRL